MSTDYNYDEQGQFFPYFVATMLVLVLGPVTYSTFAPSKQAGLQNNPRIKTSFRPADHDHIELHKKKKRKESRRLKRMIFLIVGWSLTAYMIYLIITTAALTPQIWDPYTILGISMSASEKAIKSHYRKMSIKYHPDKVKLEGNDTMEAANERWVEITKAYKALTDEEIRKNFQEYGHPDGKQSFSIGIALPQWTVAEGSKYYVLAFYGVMFGIILPYYVGKWWYGTKKFTKDGVLMDTAGRLFKAFEEDCDEKKAVEVLSAGGLEKFKHDEKNFEGQEHQIESAIKDKVPIGVMKTLQKMDGWKRKTYGLLWAYMTRTKFEDPKLDAEKLDIAQEAVSWNNSLLSIALAYMITKPILSAMKVNQNLIQAIPPGSSPLLQLPYFTEALCERIEEFGAKDHWTLQRFMSLSDEKRRSLCIGGDDGLTEEQYNAAMEVARKIPILHVEKAFFKVQGEDYVTPNAICQLVLKVRVVPAGVKPPPVDPKDLLDEDPEEDDVNALIGRQSKSSTKSEKISDEKSATATEKPAAVTPTEPPTPTLTHAPYFPADTLPKWHVFLADRRAGRMIIAPMTILQFPEKTDNFQVQTFKLQFGAPPNAGEVHFQMHLVCDSYLGTDYKQSIVLKVDEHRMLERIKEDDEISEPDEDSIAGVMASARGQSVKKSAYHDHDHDEDEDEESDTEGEEEEGSATDTDTDTDDE